jgi:hypothetical protein
MVIFLSIRYLTQVLFFCLRLFPKLYAALYWQSFHFLEVTLLQNVTKSSNKCVGRLPLYSKCAYKIRRAMINRNIIAVTANEIIWTEWLTLSVEPCYYHRQVCHVLAYGTDCMRLLHSTAPFTRIWQVTSWSRNILPSVKVQWRSDKSPSIRSSALARTVLFKIRFIILTSTPCRVFPSVFPTKMCIEYLFCMHATCGIPSHPLWFNHSV